MTGMKELAPLLRAPKLKNVCRFYIKGHVVSFSVYNKETQEVEKIETTLENFYDFLETLDGNVSLELVY